MSKFKTIPLALVAVFALSAVVSATASATQWLITGTSLSGTLSVTIGETLLLEDMGATPKLDVLCSGFFDGSITAPNLDEITKVLNLAKAEEIPLDCTVDSPTGACEENLATVTPIHLPWLTELLLVSGTTTLWLDDLTGTGGEPGYEVLCQSSLLGDVKDTCSANTSANVENTASGLLVEFSEEEAVTPPGNCTLGGSKEGLVVGNGFMTPDEGTLTVSE